MIEESVSFTRLRLGIGAKRKIKLPWSRGNYGFTTNKVNGIEVIIRPTHGEKSFILELIYVDPDKRGEGLAKEKMKEILAETTRLGMVCWLFVSPENAAAWCGDPEGSGIPKEKLVRFYKKLGFNKVFGNWMQYDGKDHQDVTFNRFSSLHRKPKKISGLRELRSGVKEGKYKKGVYANDKDMWSVDENGNIHKIVGGKHEFDWHSMNFKARQGN